MVRRPRRAASATASMRLLRASISAKVLSMVFAGYFGWTDLVASEQLQDEYSSTAAENVTVFGGRVVHREVFLSTSHSCSWLSLSSINSIMSR